MALRMDYREPLFVVFPLGDPKTIASAKMHC